MSIEDILDKKLKEYDITILTKDGRIYQAVKEAMSEYATQFKQ